MANDDKQKGRSADLWKDTTPDGVLDDDDLLNAMLDSSAPAEASAPAAPSRRPSPPPVQNDDDIFDLDLNEPVSNAPAPASSAPAPAATESEVDDLGLFGSLPKKRAEAPPPPASPAVSTSDDVASDLDMFGTLPGRRAKPPAPAPEQEQEEDTPPERDETPVQPRREKAVFESGGRLDSSQQVSLQEARSRNTKIKRVRQGSLFKKFFKLGVVLLVVAGGAGAAIYYGYHESLPVDQQTKDVMSQSVKETKQKLDKQLEDLERLAERTKAKAEQGLEKAEKVLIETEQKLKEMGEGEAEQPAPAKKK